MIAEIGVNHFDIAKDYGLSELEAAKLMILKAKKAGANAVKFQSYKASELASKYANSYWDTNEESTVNQYELFSKYDLFNKEEYAILSKFCSEIDIEFLSTPFDFEAADYLNGLVNLFKISSSDITNLPFIKYIASYNKPIIISVGASKLSEIRLAVNTIKKINDKEIVLLHCILEYPTPLEHSNLLRIKSLKIEFPDLIIGYSDHTKATDNNHVLITSYLLGAKVIEKHFTLDKSLPGNDHYHAMDESDLKKIITDINNIDKILGDSKLQYLVFESNARKNARRSCILIQPVKKGQTLSESMVSFKRPGFGIKPGHLSKWIGKKFNQDLTEDTILTPDLFY
jgi:N-acetylneuraminate synthase